MKVYGSAGDWEQVALDGQVPVNRKYYPFAWLGYMKFRILYDIFYVEDERRREKKNIL